MRIFLLYLYADLDLLYRIVEAESGNEPYLGQVAVANVILNRVRDDRFPNTIRGVIYQKHQFSGTSMMYDRATSQSVKKAVRDALNGKKAVGDDVIGFFADYLRKDHPMWRYRIVKKIGTHLFTNEY